MTARRTSASTEAIAASAHLHRTTAWHGLRVGDAVFIDGLHDRSAVWIFRAHVRNERNDTESIEVVGGRTGDRTIRSFDTGRVFTASTKRDKVGNAARGQLSLADAPQLPFG